MVMAGNAYAAKNNIDGFLGMAWGTALDEVKNNMIKKGYIFKSVQEVTGAYLFEGKFFGEETQIYLNFSKDNKFVDAQVSLKDDDKKYNEIHAQLILKYSIPSIEGKIYTIPSIFPEKEPPVIWVDNIGVLTLSRTEFSFETTIGLRYSEKKYFEQVLERVRDLLRKRAEKEQQERKAKNADL
jgi:molybdopterin converting factor small subunit